MVNIVGIISGFIALFSGWSLCWQLVFGQFEGCWGAKENRGNLAVAFIVSASVFYALSIK
jgi:hypothetical protein